jgi:O-antigen/teichoic acid export membrane protein
MTAGRRRRVARNVGVLFVGETSAQALGFVLTAYLARTLGPSGFGIWIFASAVITYLTMIVESGADTWGIREASASASRLRESLDAVVVFRLILVAVVGVLLAAGARTFVAAPERRLALMLGLPSLVAMALQSHWALRAIEITTPVAAAAAMQRLVALALVVALVHAPTDAAHVTLWQGLAELSAAVMLLAVVAARIGPPFRRLRAALVRRVAVESWPIGLARILRGATYTITVITLARFWPDSAVGEYGAAYRIPLALLALSTIFGTAVAPAVARACATSRADAGVVGAATLRLLAVLLFPLAVGGAVLAPAIMTLVFSARFLTAVTLFQVLIGTVVLSGFTDVVRRLLHFSHRQQEDLRCVATAVGVSVVLSLALIPAFGSRGAAAVAVAVELSLLVLEARALRRAGIVLRFLPSVARPALAAAVMGAAVMPLRGVSLAVSVPAGALVYLAALALLRDRTVAELHVLDVPVRDSVEGGLG